MTAMSCASGVGEPTDEDSVAALLAVLALIRHASAVSPLARWRAQRMAALARPRSDVRSTCLRHHAGRRHVPPTSRADRI